MLVTRAGGGAATNIVTSLHRGAKDLYAVGCHDDPFVLKKSNADANYLIPPANHQQYLRAVTEVIRRESIDLVMPVADADVAAVSRLRRHLGTSVFLPKPATLSLCYDKLQVAQRLRAKGIPVPVSYAVRDLDSLPSILARFKRDVGAWCRSRSGAGSLAAAPVANEDQARAWIWLWCERRGIQPSAFMIAEYLPGRDFACQSLWRGGRLVLIKTTERLAYVDGAARLSGTSSVASLHKTVCDWRLVRVAKAAILAVDPRATGAFSVDLKENDDGLPCVTEINAGRLLSGATIFDEVGRHNMSVAYVRVGTGGRIRRGAVYDSPEGFYVSRELDTVPHVFDSTGFWSGWRDARSL